MNSKTNSRTNSNHAPQVHILTFTLRDSRVLDLDMDGHWRLYAGPRLASPPPSLLTTREVTELLKDSFIPPLDRLKGLDVYIGVWVVAPQGDELQRIDNVVTETPAITTCTRSNITQDRGGG